VIKKTQKASPQYPDYEQAWIFENKLDLPDEPVATLSAGKGSREQVEPSIKEVEEND